MKWPLRARTITTHVEGCRALMAVERGDWWSPWWMSGRHSWRAADGSKKGRGHLWAHFECNTQDCNALVIVHELGLVDFLTGHLTELQEGIE